MPRLESEFEVLLISYIKEEMDRIGRYNTKTTYYYDVYSIAIMNDYHDVKYIANIYSYGNILCCLDLERDDAELPSYLWDWMDSTFDPHNEKSINDAVADLVSYLDRKTKTMHEFEKTKYDCLKPEER